MGALWLKSSLQQSTKLYRRELLAVATVDTDSADAAIEELSKLKGDARIFILYANGEDAATIFELAAKVGLTSDEYMWLVTQSVVGQNGPGSFELDPTVLTFSL